MQRLLEFRRQTKTRLDVLPPEAQREVHALLRNSAPFKQLHEMVERYEKAERSRDQNIDAARVRMSCGIRIKQLQREVEGLISLCGEDENNRYKFSP